MSASGSARSCAKLAAAGEIHYQMETHVHLTPFFMNIHQWQDYAPLS